MAGISRVDGSALSDLEDLRQSIEDILTTPVGWRTHRESYGSNLRQRIDAGVTSALGALLTADIAQALTKTVMGAPIEPRFLLRKVDITAASPGVVIVTLTGEAKFSQSEPARMIALEDIKIA